MKKVLVVDDDQRITSALTVRLKHAGYDVQSAVDGFAGLREAVTNKPDLILMDIMMPRGMGFSVAERLKSIGLPHVPIIFLTASKRTGLRKTAEQLGAAGYFEKPYNSEELLAAVSIVLAACDTEPTAPNQARLP